MSTPAGRTRITRTARLLGRAVRGLLAAILLAALVVGLPVALIYAVGWPLPDHLPTLDEIGSVLMAPISSSVLLDTLACLTWLLWLVFVLDVAACALDVARGARWPHLRTQSGPVRRVAAVLVGALLIAVLGRTATAAPIAPADTARPVGHAPVAVTAPAWPTPAASEHTHTNIPLPWSQPSAEPGTERVRAPENGVHDSLWRIAQRRLGDGARWPEIWALNKGSTQASGRVLTNPNLIHPGDTLRLPATSHTPTPPDAPSPPPSEHAPLAPVPESASPAPSTTTPPPPSTSAPPTTPAADHDGEQDANNSAGGAVTWGSGEVFVSLGLAAAISALLLLARRRHAARYRPGSGRRDDDLPFAPVVYQLRLAHLRAQHHDEDADLDAASGQDTDAPTPPQRPHAQSAVSPRSTTGAPGHTEFGTEGQVRVLTPRTRRVIGAPATSGTRPEIPPSIVDIAFDTNTDGAGGEGTTATLGGGAHVALNLARVHGLGLVGPGGYAAARALLLTLLTTGTEGGSAPRVLVPAADLARLLGVPMPATDLPDTVTVVADLDTALASLDPQNPASHPPAVLITTPPGELDQQAQLQNLLDNHSPVGVTALLLGQWRAGVTAYVTAGGIISATDPGLGEPLRGTRAFTLPETATRELLAFLRAPQPVEGAPVELDTAPGRDVAMTAPAPRQAAQPPEAEPSHPGNAGGGPDRLEITSGPPVSETPPADVSRSDDEPRPLPPLTADTVPGTPAPLVLTVFGAPALHWRPDPAQPAVGHRDLSGELSSRLVELLVYLAVHPGGVSRDGIVDALWPDAPPRNPPSVLRTVLSRIRRALNTATRGAVGELVLVEHGQYRLDPAVVEVDYWGFADAITARRTATTPERRTDACEAIVAHYGGLLAEGVDGEWLVAARQSTRRDALDAVAALARAQVDTDPDYTLDLLETARAFDPHNELLYRDIMRLQHALGRHEAISRSLTLLRTRLAELDTTPTTDTVDLAARLRAHHTGIPAAAADAAQSTAP
ncbi:MULTISPECIES: BTAD domain-containing putative transcriptional regulator [Pseudonocardiaceae]|uniref:LysM peptidoglycan-binding domain-containing protein n=1 Tax=Prauserella endophytica TaxID=1592324 RepID=A0ABY2RTR6_9PSEU|nr:MULTISPECIES: BTAD domain-containing putative transcriptional regulator [Pseudonocardiaceae]TKG60358.1 LysM peptidoglycan-binding domain-containing protein [Prauserella endophytica]